MGLHVPFERYAGMPGGDAGIVEDREQAVEVGAVAVEQQRGGIANLRLSIAVGRQSRGEG
jgi:hypothetical protein